MVRFDSYRAASAGNRAGRNLVTKSTLVPSPGLNHHLSGGQLRAGCLAHLRPPPGSGITAHAFCLLRSSATEDYKVVRIVGVDAWGAAAVGTDAQPEEDEYPARLWRAIRFSGIHFWAALQRAHGAEVHGIQPVCQERVQDQRGSGPASGAGQRSSMGGSMRA